MNLDTESNLVDHEDKSNISCNRNGDGILFIFFFGISIERTLVKILRTSIAIIFFFSIMIFKSPICIYLFIYLFIVSVI